MLLSINLERIGRNIGLIGVVTGAYFLLGLLGLLFKIPNEPVGILMPPAGLALACVLLYGSRVLPAIVIGSFCVSAWYFDFNSHYLPLYAATAVGYALMSAAGAYLIQRIIGFPNALLEGKVILDFMLLAGPISGAISATAGASMLYYLGIINPAKIPIAWISWWFGDILGVLIFTPLCLIMLAEPQLLWRRRRAIVGVPVAVTFILVVSMFYYLNAIATEQYTRQLKDKTGILSHALKNRIQLNFYALQVLKGYLIRGDSTDSTEFLILAKNSMRPYPEIESISWGKFKENSQIPALYMTAFNGAVKDNRLMTPITIVPSDIRQMLYEINNKQSYQGVLTEHDNLKIVFPLNKADLQKNHTIGFIAANIKITNLVHETLGGINTENCAITLSRGQDAFGEPKYIYSNIDRIDFPPYQTVPVQIFNETWQLQFFHDWSETYVITYARMSWIVFLGLWFTGMLGIVLLHLSGRYFRTEALVEERNQILINTKTAAEQANQAKDQFLAKISHELRTPLNGISGFAQLLEKKPTLTDDDKKQVGIIRQCASDLLKLINDILDISAMDTRLIKLEKGDFNLARLLSEVVRVCKLKADEKKLQLITQNNCLPRTFTGDEKRIKQIIVNLIDNAIKYTREGVVTVSTSYVDGVLHLSVADTGCGIKKSDLERIFSPFVQISSDDFTQEGIGLGLSIANELVRLMNGEITVTSQPGVGSLFKVILPMPISQKNIIRILQDSDDTINFANASVLVIDDSEINLLFLVGILEHLGCKIRTAMDGREGLEFIERNNYDIALIDINMPVMNGIELAKTLRLRGYTLTLVAVSAYADNEKIKEAINAGFDTYLTKPIEEAQLIELIRDSLG
ncbi:MAG: response regulator [Gammaproteobacteria bacterium]|nr:response regulator [Gammaproteobacteria bacterium]